MKHNRYEVALRVGNAVSPELCWFCLARIGYSSAELVCQPGQMARRGGIIDIFPFQGKQPYRIDWFGDQIDSIRTFDPKTMLSLEKFDFLVVPPKPERPRRASKKGGRTIFLRRSDPRCSHCDINPLAGLQMVQCMRL